jgi:hypothetical protein
MNLAGGLAIVAGSRPDGAALPERAGRAGRRVGVAAVMTPVAAAAREGAR